MATPACVRRLGVVASTTVLAIAALGGVASAAPGNGGVNGNGKGNAQSAAHSAAPATAPGQSKHDPAANPELTQPQPISTADSNTGGANGQCPDGPYCSTRDGSPSGNGNGTGKATGKPCAGCVGKADNKNPKGQLPGGSDNNAGYECDRNHGIGRSNPAHTGCTTGTAQPVGQPVTEPVNTPVTQPVTHPTTCPAGESMVAGTCVLGTSFSRPPATAAGNDVPTSVLGERVVRTPAGAVAASSSLPFTGAPTGELLALAITALTVGGALALAGRKRQVGSTQLG